MALAISVIEKLLEKYCFTLIVTHFQELTHLAQIYANVGNIHLKTMLQWGDQHYADGGQTNCNHHDSNKLSIKFCREVVDGPSDLDSGYGILMGHICGFPESIIQESKHIRKEIMEKTKMSFSPDLTTSTKVKLAKEIIQRVAIVLDNVSLSQDNIINQLLDIQTQIDPMQATALLNFLENPSL